jgi:uncharacterized protein (TIGR00255 family)
MILSMTGFGEADAHQDGVHYHAEIRSVNNRYFKSAIKLPESLQSLETDVDRVLRSRLGRGSVAYTLRVKDENPTGAYEINSAVLAEYVRRLKLAAGAMDGIRVDMAGLLDAPGVCEPPRLDKETLAARLQVIETVTEAAIDKLLEMRRAEGLALLRDLQAQCQLIRDRMEKVRLRSPAVVEEYGRRLHARVQLLTAASGATLEEDVLVREVAIFAERCDINEEVSRIASHLDQFGELCDGSEEAGRKLDFLAQEMFREANTIGSKAGDAEIARHVVEIKAAVDRIKEQVQNVE